MCENCDKLHNPQNHPATIVRGVAVDEKLAPLINLLWSLGIRTSECCQEAPNHFADFPVAGIGFENPDDATKFVTLVAASSPEYADDMLYLDDTFGENRFRCFIWYQGEVNNGYARMFPTVVVEMATENINTVTNNIITHLSWMTLTAGKPGK